MRRWGRWREMRGYKEGRRGTTPFLVFRDTSGHLHLELEREREPECRESFESFGTPMLGDEENWPTADNAAS
jgi:hypothetical protein